MTALKTEYRLSFASGLTIETSNHLRTRIATILEQPNFGSLTLLFSSEGGSTDQSLALYNFLRLLPVPIHMHAVGHVGSAAIPLFLGAEKRTCEENARFFFHEYDWGFTERQTLQRIDEAVQRLNSDIQIARDIIRERSNIDLAILDTLDGTAKPVVVTPRKAREMGLVSDILTLPTSGPDGAPIAIWT